MNRELLISTLAEMITRIQLDHPVRVGIDGVDAAGKTSLADELIEPLLNHNRSVIRSTTDGFLNPKDIRYQQGRDSALGYYEDSFNYDSIISNLLKPLGPGGNLTYRSHAFDYEINSEVDAPLERAPSDSILLFDGIFLHRPEIRDYWDFSIFVQVDFDVIISRAQERDLHLHQTAAMIRSLYETRYIPGERIYLETESPSQKATVIWDNNDITNPKLIVN